jgi:hypothetical protein
MLGGGILSATIDAVIEAVYESNPAKWTNVFPFVPTIDPLPPADDWIVLGVSAVPYIYGKATKHEKVKDIGGGMLAYAIPMIIHHTIVRAARMTAPAPATVRATAPVRVISPSTRTTPASVTPATSTGAVKFN